jgi:hypothetical protein
MDYSWMNDAMAWLAPVASQVNNFFVYPNKLLAFSGADTAEFDTPFPMTDAVFGVAFAPAKAIDWSRVTGATKGKTWDVAIGGGRVMLPVVDHIYDPEAIVIEGETCKASDVVDAVKSVAGGVTRTIFGWHNCVHFDAGTVVTMQADGSTVQRVNLPFALSKKAELQYDSAKVAIGLPLSPDAEVVFAGDVEIQDQDGKLLEETSYRTMTVVNGGARWMTVLGKSIPASIAERTATLYGSVTHHMEIGPELADVFKMIKALGGKEKVYADLHFKPDGLFVSGSGVEMIQVPVSFADNNSPNAMVRLQIALVELDKKPMSCGFSGGKPFVMFLDDKDLFIAQMEVRK